MNPRSQLRLERSRDRGVAGPLPQPVLEAFRLPLILTTAIAGLLLPSMSCGAAAGHAKAANAKVSEPAAPAEDAMPCFVLWDKPGAPGYPHEHLFPTCGPPGPLLSDPSGEFWDFSISRDGKWLVLAGQKSDTAFHLSPPFAQKPSPSSAGGWLRASCGTVLSTNDDAIYGRAAPDHYTDYACADDGSQVIGTEHDFFGRDDIETLLAGVPPHPVAPPPGVPPGQLQVNYYFAVSPQGKFSAYLAQIADRSFVVCSQARAGAAICTPFSSHGDWPYSKDLEAGGYVYWLDVSDQGTVAYVGYDPKQPLKLDKTGLPASVTWGLWVWRPPASPQFLADADGATFASPATIAALAAWSAHWHATSQLIP